MGRPKRFRRIQSYPKVVYFKPRSVPLSFLEEIQLKVDELEALKLVDFENMPQIEAAKKMAVSQSTLQRILSSARKKVAEALSVGKAIRIEGGEIMMVQGRGRRGGGQGRGRMGGPLAAGPGGYCVCSNSDCGHKVPHLVGKPCTQRKCPKCGSPMVREAIGNN